MDREQLPEGWEIKTLGEVCTLQRGFDLPKNQREEGNFLLISSSGCIDTHIEAKVFSPGVVTGRSGSIGSVFFIDEDFWPLNTTLYVKDFHENDPRFVFYLLKKFDLKRFSSGVGVPTLNRNSVHSELVIVPVSVIEQKRIVAILDEAFEGIDQAIRNTEKNLANARELFRSQLQSVFTNRDGRGIEMTLGDICQFENGDRGKNYPNREEYVELGIPWINTGHIQPDGTLSRTEMNFITREKYETLRSGKIRPGDLVYCLRGATIGKTALVDPLTIGAVASSLVIIRPNSKLDKHFLYYFLISSVGQKQIKLYDNGAAQPNLGAKSVAKYFIYLPNLAEQKVIVKNISSLAVETQKLETIYRQKLAALNELKQSILQKAFTGQLT
jgi:type I restriction enzyme S subunit